MTESLYPKHASAPIDLLANLLEMVTVGIYDTTTGKRLGGFDARLVLTQPRYSAQMSMP